MDVDTAGLLFAQTNLTNKYYSDKKGEYFEAIQNVDTAIDQSNPSEATKWDKIETALKPVYDNAGKVLAAEGAFTDKQKIGNVVYVTYTDDNGKDTTFFINYNTFDVAIELNGGIYMLAAESFVNAADESIEITASKNYVYEIAWDREVQTEEDKLQVYKPSAGQLKNYLTAKENYDNLGKNATENQKAKAKEAVDKAIAAIQNTATNVVKLTADDGSVGYFNYENASVLVRVSDTEYKVVAAQSYVID